MTWGPRAPPLPASPLSFPASPQDLRGTRPASLASGLRSPRAFRQGPGSGS